MCIIDYDYYFMYNVWKWINFFFFLVNILFVVEILLNVLFNLVLFFFFYLKYVL